MARVRKLRVPVLGVVGGGLAALVALVAPFLTATASATCGYAYSSSCKAPSVTVQSATGTTTPTSTGSLAFTGADVALTVVIGLAVIAVGLLLVWRTRRHSSAS